MESTFLALDDDSNGNLIISVVDNEGLEVSIMSQSTGKILGGFQIDEELDCRIELGNQVLEMTIGDLADLTLAVQVVKEASPRWFTKYQLYKLAKEV